MSEFRKKLTRRIVTCDEPSLDRVSILVPVLNECRRIAGSLESLIAQPQEVQEILVIDGGSHDGTQALVTSYQQRDRRVELIDATPMDPRWTGKAWGLHFGLQRSNPKSQWILCFDADVRASPHLVRSLLSHSQRTGVDSFSVATDQRLSGMLEGLIHPAMLTTLVYRFGAPGRATQNIHNVQANGQCFLARRETLLQTEAFAAARMSLCEDVTIVRRLAECGETVGFYESDRLVVAQMYADWRETWNNWPRSLPMRDQYFGWREGLGLAVLLLFQGLPLPLLILGLVVRAPAWLLVGAGLLTIVRLGVLFGVARAYPKRPWTYWLSPLFDPPVVLRIIQSAVARRHSWRGRVYVRRKGGRFEPLQDSGTSRHRPANSAG